MPTTIKKPRPQKSPSAGAKQISRKPAPGKARSDSSRPQNKPVAAAKSSPAKKVSPALKLAETPHKNPAPAAKNGPAAKKIAPAKNKSSGPAEAAPAKIAAQKTPAANPPSPAVSAKSAAAIAKQNAAAAAIAAHPEPAGDPNASSYFLLLSSHERKGRRFIKLKAPSVLAWFQRAWRLAAAGRNWNIELGGEVYGLNSLEEAILSRRLPMPASEALLQPLLTKYLSVERDLEMEPHFVHVDTDDDEVQIEYFFFDDAFLAGGEALDRLPSPKRRPKPLESEETSDEESLFAEEEEEDDDDDPYTQLIHRLADE